MTYELESVHRVFAYSFDFYEIPLIFKHDFTIETTKQGFPTLRFSPSSSRKRERETGRGRVGDIVSIYRVSSSLYPFSKRGASFESDR